MFTYQRNDSGQCSEDGCDCVCDSKADTNGNCVTRSSSKNDLFRFSTGIHNCFAQEYVLLYSVEDHIYLDTLGFQISS